MLSLAIHLCGYPQVAKGLVLGALFSVLNFIVMAQLLPVQIGMGAQRRKVTALTFAFVLLRFILMAVPLFVGLRLVGFSFWGVVAGLLAVPIGIMVENVAFHRRRHCHVSTLSQ